MLMKLKEIHAPGDGYNFPTDQRFTRFQGTTTKKKTLVTTKDKTAYTKTINNYFKDEVGMFDQSGNFIDYKGIGGDNRFADGGVGRGNFAAIINQILKDNDIDNVEATTSAFYPNSIKLGDTRYGFTQNDWEYGKFMKALDKIIMGDGAVQYSAPTKEDDD